MPTLIPDLPEAHASEPEIGVGGKAARPSGAREYAEMIVPDVKRTSDFGELRRSHELCVNA